MNSPTRLKKQIAKEEKHDNKLVKTVLSDLSHAQKLQSKAEKARSKATKAVRKASDKESSALKTLEKATYEHDVAVAGMHKAESDAKRTEKQTRDAQRNLEGAKVRADSLAREQQHHKREREAMAQIDRGLMTSDSD